MKRSIQRTGTAEDEQSLNQLLQEAASIKPGSREALYLCFGQFAGSADELKQLETVVEQLDVPFGEKTVPSATVE